LLASAIADVDRAASAPPLTQPTLYKAFKQTPAAFANTLPPADPNAAAVIRVDFANSVTSAGARFFPVMAKF